MGGIEQSSLLYQNESEIQSQNKRTTDCAYDVNFQIEFPAKTLI